MKNYKNILVQENDSKEIPCYLQNVLRKETVDINYWYDFSMSFYRNNDGSFKRLHNVTSDTLMISAPSFVGLGNEFEGYLMLFLKLKELGTRVTLAIIYTDNFFVMLLNFLTMGNALKKKNNHELLKEVLPFHTIYEIKYTGMSNDSLSDVTHITYELLMAYFYETKMMVKVVATGEIYEVYRVYYVDPVENTDIVLRIESNPNNKFKPEEIERI